MCRRRAVCTGLRSPVGFLAATTHHRVGPAAQPGDRRGVRRIPAARRDRAPADRARAPRRMPRGLPVHVRGARATGSEPAQGPAPSRRDRAPVRAGTRARQRRTEWRPGKHPRQRARRAGRVDDVVPARAVARRGRAAPRSRRRVRHRSADRPRARVRGPDPCPAPRGDRRRGRGRSASAASPSCAG